MNGVGLLKGNKIHLTVVPKLGSSGLRNFFTKDIKHSESTHHAYPLSELNDTIIVFFKSQEEIFQSSIQTDFRASVLVSSYDSKNNQPSNFPRYNNFIYSLDQNQRRIWMNLLETNTPHELNSRWDVSYGDKTEFFNFATHVIETAFDLNNDISWMVTGHFSDSFHLLPKLLKLDNALVTDISSLSNPNFITWLKKQDESWKHLNENTICNTSKIFDFYDNGNGKSWNASPSNYKHTINSWLEFIVDKTKKPKNYFLNFSGNYLDSSILLNSETSMIQANYTFLYTLYNQFEFSNTLYKCVKQTSKYLNFNE